MAEWRYKIQTNIKEVVSQLRDLQNKVDKLENGEHQIKLDIDSKKLERVITNLDKMLESLGKGTGDFKEFENLSKQLTNIISEVQTLNKSLGGVNDKGISNLLSSISNIDKTLSSLSEHIINVNKDFGKIGDEAGNNVGQINKVADATNELADATNKLNDAQKNAGNKSNISSGNENLVTSDLGLSYDKLIKKIQEENKNIKEGNDLFRERVSYLNNNSVVASILGTDTQNNGDFSHPPANRIVHSHPEYKNAGEVFSPNDISNFIQEYLYNKVSNFDLIWKKQILSMSLPKDLSRDVAENFSQNYSALYDAIRLQLGENGSLVVPKELQEQCSKYINAALVKMVEEIGGSIKFYSLKDSGDINKIQNPQISDSDYTVLYSTLLRIKDIDFDGNIEQQLNNIKKQVPPLIENVDTLYRSLKVLYGLSDKSNLEKNIQTLMPFLSNEDVLELNNILSSSLTEIDLKMLAEAVYNQLYTPILESKNELLELKEVANSSISIKDPLQNNTESSPTTSASAITEESNALEKVSSSATEAANAKEKFSEANKEVKSSADASVPSVEKESDALDNVSKRSRSDSDNVKLEQRARIYKELNSCLDRYAIVAGRVANEKTLSTDEEEMARLQVRIEELQNEPILSETQLELSRAKLEKIETSLENIQEKVQLNKLDTIQKSIDSYSKDYKRRNDGKPIEENRNKEYQQLLDQYKASIDALQAKKDELAKQPTISDDDLQSVKNMTDAVERNKNALLAMSAAEKGSDEKSRRKEIDKITKYLKDNTRLSEEAKVKLKEYLDLLRSGDPSVNVGEIHNKFLEVTDAERLAGNEGKRFLDVIRDKAWYGWAAQIASYFSLQDIIRYFKEGATVVKEFDDGLTNISYTMDVTKSQLDGIGQSVLDLSKDLKSSIDDSMQVAKIYANMNTTAEEIKKLSEPTLIMTNLTGFDAATMADDIQAVTQQFEIAAEDSMHIADVYDTVSRSISVDYSKGIESIAEAVQVAGATAKQAGLSFEDLSAIVGKTAEKTRLEGSSIGNGLKTIFTRLSRVGELSDEVDNETLSKASESLHQIGVEVYNADGSYRNFKTIMSELAAKWGSLTDAEKANISFNIAA